MKKFIFSAALLAGITATAQNTGIGTTKPQGKLHVAGNTIIGDYVNGKPGTLILNPTSTNEGGQVTINRDPKYGTVDWTIDQIGGNGTTSDLPRFRIYPGANESRGLSFLESGYLGLGVTNPQARLDIAGNIKITDGTQGVGKVLTSDANGLAIWQTPVVAPTYTGSSSVLLNGASFERAALTGDVTAAQNTNITTIAAGAVTSAKIADGTITAADLSNLGATTAGQSLVWSGSGWVPTTPTAANSANIYTKDGTLAANRTVTMGGNNIAFSGVGNFGIGTTDLKSNKLTVSGLGAGTNQSTLKLTTPGAALAEKSNIGFYSTFNSGTADLGPRRTADIVSGFSTAAWGNEYLSFNVGSATDANNLTSEKMRIQSNGNVGIGTNNPLAKLDVLGNIKIADGTQGAGKILTSDANGLATWVAPTAANSSNIYTTDGTLSGARTVTMGANPLTFNGTAPFNVNTKINANYLSLNAQDGNTEGGELFLSGTTNSPNGIYIDQNTNNFRIFTSGAGARNLIQSNTVTGFTGINNTAPNSQLDVVGGIRAAKGATTGDGGNVGFTFNKDGDTGLFAENGTPVSGSTLTLRNDNAPQISMANGVTTVNNNLAVQGKTVLGNTQIADGSQGNGRVLVSDANGNASWQTMAFPPPSLGATQTWKLPDMPNDVDPTETPVTFGPFTVSTTGWYQLVSRWFFVQNSLKSDDGSAHYWIQIDSRSGNLMDQESPTYESRGPVNLLGTNTSMGLIYLDKNLQYYVHQSTHYTVRPATGERGFILRLLNGQ